MRSQVRRALRRAASSVGPIERLYGTLAQQRDELDRLGADLTAVRGESHRATVFADFFAMLGADGDVDRAAVSTTRKLLPRPGGTSEARIIAQVLQQYDGMRPIAEICLALCAFAEPMPEPAWTLLTRNDLALVVRWAAEEYFQLGFQHAPDTAAASLARVLGDEIRFDADPHVWMEIAYASFSAGSVALAAQTIERAEQAMADVTDPARIERLRARLSTLRAWVDRAAGPAQPVELLNGEIPFAVVGFNHPDWKMISRDIDDYVETLAAFGHLLRHEGTRFVGEADLVELAERLRGDVPAQSRIPSAEATVRLHVVDRDASQYAAVPDGTWVLVSEWFTRPLAGCHYDMPLDSRLRPIFVSFHITPNALRTPGAVSYLRDHAPIGCRDWDTVFLLHAAGISAFFSGPLTATVNHVLRSGSTPGEPPSGQLQAARERTLGENLAVAAAELRSYRDDAATNVPSVPLYSALRALGRPVEFRLDDAEDYRALDVAELADDEFAEIQRGISEKLAAVFGALVSGRPEKEVYEAWREACAADVAKAEARLRSFPDYPKLSFDLAEVCAAIRSTSVVRERTEPGPEGPEINVEFSVDENYKHQLDIVLDSVVERASRPVRAFVLCRGYGPDDFERMAWQFPTVSFVWLPTGRVDYGNVRGKIPWATIVTMDRTILPELLRNVDRIIHFDLDALCLGDLAELFDTDMTGAWVAAADEPQPNYGRGFNSLRDSARLLRREGFPELAREYIIRTHRELEFDFEIFNAGVMVLNLAEMRAGGFCEHYLAYVERFGINGQRVLNVGVGARRRKISADWNRLLRLEVSDSVKVAHWAGPFKPWAGHPYVPGRELWRAQEERFAERTQRLAPVSR